MRLVSTESLKPKTKLGKPVYNEKGHILLNEGVTLTEKIISRLIDKGITYVYIQDPKTDGIEQNYPISSKTRSKAVEAIEEAFDIVQKEKELSNAFVFDGLGKKFSTVVCDILTDIQDNKAAISLLADVYSYDNYIFTHSLNVTIYSLALGMQLKLNQRQLEEIGLGAILHDVGKMQIPLEILLKPAKLTDHEFELIKKHTEHGFDILRKIPNMSLVTAHCAYQHHERIDGSGYPRGLKGDDIHYYSKLIGIADVYDAVTSNRVYRSAMLPHEGLEILYAGAGTQFEHNMVEAFRKAVAVYPAGITVILNDNRKGIVVRQNEGLSERPVIRILEEDGKELTIPYELDLAKELSIVIKETDTTLVGKKK